MLFRGLNIGIPGFFKKKHRDRSATAPGPPESASTAWYTNDGKRNNHYHFWQYLDLANAKSQALVGSFEKCLFKVKFLWACDHFNTITGQRRTFKKFHLNELYIRARDAVMWYWSANTLFWQLSCDHNMSVRCQVKHDLCMAWTLKLMDKTFHIR